MLQNKFGLARKDTVGGYRDLMLSVIFSEPRYRYIPACRHEDWEGREEASERARERAREGKRGDRINKAMRGCL